MGAALPRARLAVAALVITLAALLIYGGVLFSPDQDSRYPWSSDSWGHLIKAEYLRDQIREGHWYPDLFPHWYNGQQMLRYYAPLPYYLLVGLLAVTGDIFTAANWFLFLAALGGGLSMLLFAPRTGLAFATIGGVLLVLLPDNLRVAFAEGNLPRVLSASLLPAAFYCLVQVLTSERHRRAYFAGLALLLSLVVLTHAMMAAIFGVSMALFTIIHWLVARTRTAWAGLGLLGILSGVLLAGWWLLPSLTGGITELDAQAASEALARFPWYVVLNPVLRMSDREVYYIGASYVLVLGLAVAYWRHLDGLARALVIVGFITLLVSSTLVNEVYHSLPLHHLFWPLRFMTFAGFVLVLAAAVLLSVAWRSVGPGVRRAGRFLVIGVVVAIALDFWLSAPLAHTRHAPPDLLEVAESLRDSPGWRVATVDLSQLGSVPSYLFTSMSGKEQVYGWAFQGAITAPVLGMLNQAIEKGYAAYAVDRLERLGADHVLLLKTEPEALFAYRVSPELRGALAEAGYAVDYQGQRVTLYSRPGTPRAYRLDMKVLGIGSGAQNLALLFPEIVAGTDTKLDRYDIGFLKEFDVLFLSGFNWEDKERAERIVTELAESGQRVVVDLTGTPVDSLARIPKFLGVYGERMALPDRPRIVVNGTPARLRAFSPDYSPWQAVVPQGVDSREVFFEFGGVEATIVGMRRVGQGTVTFLGVNLPFHAVLTGDPVAIGVLESELGVQAHRRPSLDSVPLDGYLADQRGYTFSVDAREPGYYLIPVARHSGTRVYVDGKETPSLAVDSLTVAHLPAGAHRLEIVSLRTPIYAAGIFLTMLGVLIVLSVMLAGVRHPLAVVTYVRREARTLLPRLRAAGR